MKGRPAMLEPIMLVDVVTPETVMGEIMGWYGKLSSGQRMAQRLLEASDRSYWTPDPATLAALQTAADELEDRLEGIAAE